jgi:hypothetical protein
VLLPLAKDQNYDRLEFRTKLHYLFRVNEEGDCRTWEMRGRVNGELEPEFGADLLFSWCSMRSIIGVSVGEETAVLEDKGRGTWKLYGKLDMLRRLWSWVLTVSNEMPPHCRSSRARANSISKCYNMPSNAYVKSPEMPVPPNNFYRGLKTESSER